MPPNAYLGDERPNAAGNADAEGTVRCRRVVFQVSQKVRRVGHAHDARPIVPNCAEGLVVYGVYVRGRGRQVLWIDLWSSRLYISARSCIRLNRSRVGCSGISGDKLEWNTQSGSNNNAPYYFLVAGCTTSMSGRHIDSFYGE